MTLTRSTPMRRAALRSSAPAPRPAKQTMAVARPREVATASVALPMARQAPKFTYVRDDRLKLMCRALPCQHCGAAGPDAGVTWAHSNQAAHGKGKGIKASDLNVAALCHRCHGELDQGGAMTEPQRVAMWDRAHARTVYAALHARLWPEGLPLPVLTLAPDGAYTLA